MAIRLAHLDRTSGYSTPTSKGYRIDQLTLSTSPTGSEGNKVHLSFQGQIPKARPASSS